MNTNLKTLTVEDVKKIECGYCQVEVVTNDRTIKELHFYIGPEEYIVTCPYGITVEKRHQFDVIDGFVVIAYAPLTGHQVRETFEHEWDATSRKDAFESAGYTDVKCVPTKLERWVNDPLRLIERFGNLGDCQAKALTPGAGTSR